MPVAATTAALISTGVNASIAGANAASQGKSNKKSRDFQREMQIRQNYLNTENWKLQNQYNHPTQQMQRLKEAGLNPHLVYGQGANNVSDPIRSATAPTSQEVAPKLQFDASNELMKYQNVKQTQQTIDNLQAQNAVIRQNELLLKAQTLKTLADADISKTDGYIKKRIADEIIVQSGYDTVIKENEAFIKQNTAMFENDMKLQKLQEIMLKNAHTAEQIKIAKNTAMLQKLDMELRKQGIMPTDPAYMRIITQVLSGNSDILESAKSQGTKVKRGWTKH